jgi:tRNA-modifying protein YgfZ
MTTPLPHGACRLDDWGVLEALGPDAAAFLQAQLTQSVSDLDAARARPGGYCSAKGRLLASFVLLRPSPEQVLLLLPLELLAPLQRKLSMFVLRSKVKLQPLALPLHGLLGDAVPEALPVWGVDGAVLRLPDALGQRRGLQWGDTSQPAIERGAWDWADIHAGLAWVRAATSEHFVPQMVNWELVGGVDFKKGCFPGQEVVARSQYRGTVKRRMQLLLGAAAAPGSPVFAGDDEVGEVVQAAKWAGQAGLLAELQLAAWSGDAPLRLGDGAALQRAALPYAVEAPQ